MDHLLKNFRLCSERNSKYSYGIETHLPQNHCPSVIVPPPSMSLLASHFGQLMMFLKHCVLSKSLRYSVVDYGPVGVFMALCGISLGARFCTPYRR